MRPKIYHENIKKIEQINSYKVLINGDEFVKAKNFVKIRDHILNHINFDIHGHTIAIQGNMCFKCGRVYKKEELKALTKHHAIPSCLDSKYNVLLPICRKPCHNDINSWWWSRKTKKDEIGGDKK